MTISSTPERSAILAAAVEVAGDYGLDLVGGTLLTESGLLFSPDTFVTIVHARLAAEREYVRDDRGRFGEGDGGYADKADTKFTTAADIKFSDWARQFPKGTVFRAGHPGRVEAMRHGQDLGTPDTAGPSGEVSDAERIRGVWVSDSAKAEYLDTGEVMAAFDVHGLPVVNEGAPGDMLLSHIPADRLIGMWTPGPAGARGFDAVPPQMRGSGKARGIAPVGKAVTASFDESLHPRDRGRFAEKEGDASARDFPVSLTAADLSGKGFVKRDASSQRDWVDKVRPAALADAERSGLYERIRAEGVRVTVQVFVPKEGKPEVSSGHRRIAVAEDLGVSVPVYWYGPGYYAATGQKTSMDPAEYRRLVDANKGRAGSFDEELHPRDERGRFGDKGGDATPSSDNPKSEPQPADVPRTADGKLDTAAFVAANPQKPDEDIFVYQGRLAHMIDGSQDQSDLLFAIRERYDPVESVAAGMNQWQAEHGLDSIPAGVVEVHADLAEADAAGRAFENTPDQSSDPHVQAAYDDFKAQSEEMFDYMTRPKAEGGMGVTVEFSKETDPYPTAAAQAADLRDNNRIVIQSGLGGQHQASMSTEEYDRFRAVHDVFGHAAIGGGFDRHGEYEAWLVHSMMYEEPGRSAMSTEYHGVNSAMWSGDTSNPGGTGKTILLGEFATPPWERTQAAAMQAAVWVTPPEIAELIRLVGYDANFANHYKPCRWHFDEMPMQAAAWLAYSPDQARDELGRFGEGTSAGDAPLIEAHAKTAELVTLGTLPQKVHDAVMGKITGPVPPEKPADGWPGGKVPQPPEGQSWGLGTTPEEVRANYEAMFERGMANPESREEGMAWYDKTHDEAAALGEQYGYDMEQTAGTLAAMSAGTRWETEMPIMETMMQMDAKELDFSADRLEVVNAKLEKMGEEPVSNGMPIREMSSAQAIQVMFNEHMTNGPGGWGAQYSFNQYERALDMLRGDSVPVSDLNGIKVREFYNNISNPGVEDHVTIDVMMMRIASGNNDVFNDTRITSAPSYKTVGLGPTPFLADEVRRIADAHSMTANDVQAVMWVQYLDEQQAAGRGGARGKA
jgi:hypothetical protein